MLPSPGTNFANMSASGPICVNNAFMAKQAIAIRSRLKGFRRTQLRHSNRLARSREEHEGIMNAMAQADGEEASVACAPTCSTLRARSAVISRCKTKSMERTRYKLLSARGRRPLDHRPAARSPAFNHNTSGSRQLPKDALRPVHVIQSCIPKPGSGHPAADPCGHVGSRIT
jgi:FCD domain